MALIRRHDLTTALVVGRKTKESRMGTTDDNGPSDMDQQSNHDCVKRRRLNNNEGGGENKASSANNDRTHYKEILEGHVNDQVLNSWLRCTRKITATTTTSTISPNQSLGRQLLQVKRRLWPAAEQCAYVWGSQPSYEFTEARRICNPMEPLGEGRHGGMNHDMFMNRSAIKLANLDAILNFTLTQVSGQDFLFVDLCAAPGGFSEYLMKRFQTTRTSGSCRGYGMSLYTTNEHGKGTPWKLGHINEEFGQVKINYHVSVGSDGTGDIYRWENVVSFSDGIQYDIQVAGLPQQKVHLVVCDGGFDAQRDSECQEEIAQKLVLCEIASGLHLLQLGGRLVVKMFGFQTPVMRTAMKSIYYYFNEILVLKPITSRPASAERYVVCTGFRGVSVDWDGPTWMNSILLGRNHNSHNITSDGQILDLNTSLDEVDGDILDLNLNSCFAILSYLERKAAAPPPAEGEYSAWEPEYPRVNVDYYKHAWRLLT